MQIGLISLWLFQNPGVYEEEDIVFIKNKFLLYPPVDSTSLSSMPAENNRKTDVIAQFGLIGL